MATLTEKSSLQEEKDKFTKLYIPKEDLSDFSAAQKDKDLI